MNLFPAYCMVSREGGKPHTLVVILLLFSYNQVLLNYPFLCFVARFTLSLGIFTNNSAVFSTGATLTNQVSILERWSYYACAKHKNICILFALLIAASSVVDLQDKLNK